MKRFFLFFGLVFLSVLSVGSPCRAQDFSVGINAAQVANLATLDFTASYAVARHWSLDLNVRLNPWQFGRVDETAPYEEIVEAVKRTAFNKREGGAVGVRFWPWYSYSGLWLAARAQATTYDRGGWVFKERRKGVAYGGCLGFGWAWMVNSHLNIDLGVFGWAGRYKGRVFEDLYHTSRFKEEEGPFVNLDEIMVGIVYVF